MVVGAFFSSDLNDFLICFFVSLAVLHYFWKYMSGMNLKIERHQRVRLRNTAANKMWLPIVLMRFKKSTYKPIAAINIIH